MPKKKPLKKGSSSAYAATLRKIKLEQKEYAKSERERYKNPPLPFEVGEEVVLIQYRHEDKKAFIVKKNIKTYTVDCQGTLYRVDKMNFGGYPTYFDEPGTTSKMLVGEYVTIKKLSKNED